MSQVVVTSDNLRDKRASSLVEEQKIDTKSQFSRWQQPVGKPWALIEKSLGIVVLPVVAFWGFLFTMLSIGFGAVLVCFRFFGSLIPGKPKPKP